MIPKISIIILSYNNVKDTIECLHSMQEIDYENYDIILVDNASKDQTIQAVTNSFPQVHIIDADYNKGYAECNNIGIRYALSHKAEYIFILNNDTVVDTCILRAFVSSIQENPKIGILSGRIYWYSQPTLLWFDGARWKNDVASFVPHHSYNEFSDAVDNSSTDYACGCAMFVRSEILSKVGMFDPRFFLTWEEADLCYRVRRAGYHIMVESKAKIWHKV